MTAATKRRGMRGGVRRSDRPQPCQRCRRPIVWGLPVGEDGKPMRRRDDPSRFAFVALNADPVRTGEYAYLRGPAGRPVVRELVDELERLRWAETDRYTRHRDTVRDER